MVPSQHHLSFSIGGAKMLKLPKQGSSNIQQNLLTFDCNSLFYFEEKIPIIIRLRMWIHGSILSPNFLVILFDEMATIHPMPSCMSPLFGSEVEAKWHTSMACASSHFEFLRWNPKKKALQVATTRTENHGGE